MSVGHVSGAGLAAGGDETHGVAARDGVENRQVVDRHHAVGGIDAAGLEERSDDLADGRVFGHVPAPSNPGGVIAGPRPSGAPSPSARISNAAAISARV